MKQGLNDKLPKRNQVGLRLGEMLPGSTDNGEPGVPVTGKPLESNPDALKRA